LPSRATGPNPPCPRAPSCWRFSRFKRWIDALPEDYAERVYAGVLGKLIGIDLGRPFEGWIYERILKELGEIDGYVNERLPGKPPLVVADDAISGTFTFLRALPDYGCSPDLAQRHHRRAHDPVVGWAREFN